MKRLPQTTASQERVALLLPPALTESFEICLARAVDLADDPNVDLTVIACDGTVKGCVVSGLSNSAICNHCRYVRDVALDELVPGVKKVSIDDCLLSSSVAASNPALETELRKGVTSTLKTFYRVDIGTEKATPLRRAVFRLIEQKWLRYSRAILAGLRNYLAENAPHRLEFFNGRIVPTRAALLAVTESGTDFGIVEVFGEKRRLFTTKNTAIHDLRSTKDELQRYCQSDAAKEELGRRFFEGRRSGRRTDERPFTEGQRAGLLPELTGGRVLAIFTSSPDELEVSGHEWFTEASSRPSEFIARVRELLPDDYRVVVRMHPNQRGDRTGQSEAMLKELSATPGIVTFGPRSRVSSYELLDRAHYVLTFGSTIGLEAVYWGKPSILAGRAIWEDMGITFNVTTPQDVVDLIAKERGPLSRDVAVKVASFLMDDRGHSSTLSWGDGDQYGFFVNGVGYLPLKRRSLHYFLARSVDKLMRLHW